jgi:hypothetical protein
MDGATIKKGNDKDEASFPNPPILETGDNKSADFSL